MQDFMFETGGLGSLLSTEPSTRDKVEPLETFRGYCFAVIDGKPLMRSNNFTGSKAKRIELQQKLPCTNPFIGYSLKIRIKEQDDDGSPNADKVYQAELLRIVSCRLRKAEVRSVFSMVIDGIDKEGVSSLRRQLSISEYIRPKEIRTYIGSIDSAHIDGEDALKIKERLHMLANDNLLSCAEKVELLTFVDPDVLRKTHSLECLYLSKLKPSVRVKSNKFEFIVKLWFGLELESGYDKYLPEKTRLRCCRILNMLKRALYNNASSYIPRKNVNPADIEAFEFLLKERFVCYDPSNVNYMLDYEVFISNEIKKRLLNLSNARVQSDDFRLLSSKSADAKAMSAMCQKNNKITILYSRVGQLSDCLYWLKTHNTIFRVIDFSTKGVDASKLTDEGHPAIAILDMSHVLRLDLYNILERLTSVRKVLLFVRSKSYDLGCMSYCYYPKNSTAYYNLNDSDSWELGSYRAIYNGLKKDAKICLVDSFDYFTLSTHLSKMKVSQLEHQAYAVNEVLVGVWNKLAKCSPKKRICGTDVIGLVNDTKTMQVDGRTVRLIWKDMTAFVRFPFEDKEMTPKEKLWSTESSEEMSEEEISTEEKSLCEKPTRELKSLTPCFCRVLEKTKYTKHSVTIIFCSKLWNWKHLKEVVDRTTKQLIVYGNKKHFLSIRKILLQNCS